MVEAQQIIISPVLTEKTNMMRETGQKKYTFRVHPRANKIEIMNAVSELFSVRPTKCNVLNVKPKPRMARTRSGWRKGNTTPWKKAIVTLEAGQHIDIIEGS